MIQSTIELNSVVASFLEIARWRIDSQSGQETAAYCHNENETENENNSSEVNLEDTIEDMELDGKRNIYMILIGNLDRELCPSTAIEFLYQHTQVTSSVFIFPSLSSETFTRGAVMLHTEHDFQKLADFLENPNQMITSSTDRPWTIIEKQVGLKNIKASIGTLLPKSEDENNRKSNNLKIVCSGTQEFERARAIRDLYLEFFEHQVRLHKKLASMEGSICVSEI
ncbi:hypothetical protein P8452_36730 [Trifolium repens]|nr:hypothetical protein P8452_36730 [Trifolium repens]